MQQRDSQNVDQKFPDLQTSKSYRSAIEQQIQSSELSYLAQRDLMLAVDAYINQSIVITTAVLLRGDQINLEMALLETRSRLAIDTLARSEEILDQVCADIATRAGVEAPYREIRNTARTMWEAPPRSQSATKAAVPDPRYLPSALDRPRPFNQPGCARDIGLRCSDGHCFDPGL